MNNVSVWGPLRRAKDKTFARFVRSYKRLYHHHMRKKVHHVLIPYLFILPMLLFSILLVIWPVINTFWISLHRWIISLGESPQLIGFQNYLTIMTDKYFWNAVMNTVLFVVGTVPTSMFIGLVTAVLLNRAFAFRSLLRGVFFFPTIASTIVIAVTWKYMFSEQVGIVPYFLGIMGLESKDWLTDPSTALGAVIISCLWQNTGFMMVIYLAALQGIPKTLIEASQVDGANKYQIFYRMILPLIAPASLFAAVIGMINGFKVFDQVYVMTEGGPGYSTTTLVQYIYEKGFEHYDMGSASAASIIMFLMLLIFTIIQVRIQGGGKQ